MEKILVLNPGSTSTKIALYDGDQEVWKESLTHSREELKGYARIVDQLEFRYALVMDTLRKHGVAPGDLTAIASRGGPFAPVHSGAYEVNDAMCDKICTDPLDIHASLLGALIARKISKEAGIKAYIYDAVSVDELLPICRITGVPELPREIKGHNLNMRAAALKLCRDKGWDYYQKNIIVAHLGGGISVSLQMHGRVADIAMDDDGPFAPERAGMLSAFQVINCIDSGAIDIAGVRKLCKGSGGLVAWLGTNDSRVVEDRALAGDEKAKMVYDAMALNVAKCIAHLAAVCCGKVDQIILTGGIAYSKYFTGFITEHVDWIAPVTVMPGENEMKSLAEGVLRVLRGEETARTYPDAD